MLISDPSEAAPLLLAGTVPDSAAALLREARYRVRSAASAAALLRLAAGEPRPGLILLGETVGDQPGLDLLSRLRDDATTRAVPVLFVSSGGDEELALALGAADCLSLPLRPLVLLARVQAQLTLHQLLARPPAGAAA
ncbi:DNA-binding response OmpR family regulator [Pelomonas saccharophila]|uniref:DNA-binding response OmpR family regulator n=1 Tax=Roseateles saccharophilus TaxID=304 RepID=A0ABU1YP51_ROSSA|nr:response regulator [Roseateles saccharophilus]MDR7270638.1 DNA-binding response OmpR family regulator [Roseateles saccharophilus]